MNNRKPSCEVAKLHACEKGFSREQVPGFSHERKRIPYEPRRRAFTLFEILLVIVILALLAMVTIPMFSGSYDAEHMPESSKRIRSLLSMARASAMNDALRYRVTFERDGTLSVSRQKDAISAPHEYVSVAQAWAELDYVLPSAWIEKVRVLPHGPPPLNVEDDLVEFKADENEPLELAAYETEPFVDFQPDGSSLSARWILRDARGLGLQMTLDGRLGRVAIAEVDAIPKDDAAAPKRLTDAERKERAAGRSGSQ
ncbi:MAG: prepilin-type N-terminal cleavage/methylation domain-containing protein [Phycisphaerales bacterium]|nr:prepilin-type N-terminal cleavage/methylation domain-containing protein [Phycisphaerales bacterium]